MVLPVEGGDWYEEEALLLGVVFSILEREVKRSKDLLEDLNLNFGANGKCSKKRKSVGRGVVDLEGGEDVFNGEC